MCKRGGKMTLAPKRRNKKKNVSRRRRGLSPTAKKELEAIKSIAKINQQAYATAGIPLTGITKPGPNDVLLGRGGKSIHNEGNKKFRQFVMDMKPEYFFLANSERYKKIVISWKVIHRVRYGQTPYGRFLTENADGTWKEAGDEKAKKKTSQALREGLQGDSSTSSTGKGSQTSEEASCESSICSESGIMFELDCLDDDTELEKLIWGFDNNTNNNATSSSLNPEMTRCDKNNDTKPEESGSFRDNSLTGGLNGEKHLRHTDGAFIGPCDMNGLFEPEAPSSTNSSFNHFLYSKYGMHWGMKFDLALENI